MKEVYRFFVNGDIVFGKIFRDKMLFKCENYYRLRILLGVVYFMVVVDLFQKYIVLDFYVEEFVKQFILIDVKNFYNIEILEIFVWGKE